VRAPSGPTRRARSTSREFGFDQATAGSNVFDFEPPDQALCVGNGFVVEGVNLALAIYSPQGKLLAGPASLNDFFADELTDPRNLSDPRCLYDPGSNRWFVTLTQFATTAPTSSPGTATSSPRRTWRRTRPLFTASTWAT
jgi:hypothetical protein